MKTIYTLIIAAFALSACNETPEPIDIPEPTSYDVKFVIECDSCEGGLSINNNIIFFDSVYGIREFDTVLQSNDDMTVSCFDSSPNVSTYHTSIFVDSQLANDTLAIGDTTNLFLSIFSYYILN